MFAFRLLFSTEAMDKEPSLSKVTNGKKKKKKNCIGFIVFLFSPKINFLLAGTTIIHRCD